MVQHIQLTTSWFLLSIIYEFISERFFCVAKILRVCFFPHFHIPPTNAHLSVRHCRKEQVKKNQNHHKNKTKKIQFLCYRADFPQPRQERCSQDGITTALTFKLHYLLMESEYTLHFYFFFFSYQAHLYLFFPPYLFILREVEQ